MRDFRRMVRKIVVNRYAPDFTAYLESTPDARELLQRRSGCTRVYADVRRRSDRTQCILDIVSTRQSPFDGGGQVTSMNDIKDPALSGFHFARLPVCRRTGRRRKAFKRRPASATDDIPECFVMFVDYDPRVGRNGSQQVMKLDLYGLEIAEDVRMIKFQVVEYQRFWAVVNEL